MNLVEDKKKKASFGQLKTQALLSPRLDLKNLINMYYWLIEQSCIVDFLESAESLAFVLSETRQIVAVNQRVVTLLNVENSEFLVGLRPGEAFECMNAYSAQNGCSTSKECKKCGAFVTILRSTQTGLPCLGECSLKLGTPKGVIEANFTVKAIPLCLKNHDFTLLTLTPSVEISS